MSVTLSRPFIVAMLWLPGCFEAGAGTKVQEHEQQVEITVDVWVDKVAATEDPVKSFARCFGAPGAAPAHVALDGRKAQVPVLCVKVLGRLIPDARSDEALSDEFATNADLSLPSARDDQGGVAVDDLGLALEIKDSEGDWRLLRTLRSEDLLYVEHHEERYVLGLLPVYAAALDSLNQQARHELGAAYLPCEGVLRVVVREQVSMESFGRLGGVYQERYIPYGGLGGACRGVPGLSPPEAVATPSQGQG